MRQEVVYTQNPNPSQAVGELYQKLSNKNNLILVMFLASSHYDFQKLTIEMRQRFPNCEVVGATTSGEIGPHGFVERSIVLTTMSCTKTKVKGVLLEDVVKFPITQKTRLLEAAGQCGIRVGDPRSHTNAFAITFTNGLINREETVPALLHALLKNKQFQIAGSCAGDDLKYVQTWVSLNGLSTCKGAVVLFFRTDCKFDIRKENLYRPLGQSVTVTDIDWENRVIRALDGRNPLEVYARKLGLPREQALKQTLKYPMGRIIGDDIYMCSVRNFNNDGTLGVYLNITPNTKLEILSSANVMEIVQQTCQSVTQKVGTPGFVFMVNCMLRTMDLRSMKLCEPVIQTYRHYFKNFCGYSCYGEQLNRIALNQTLVLVTIGE